MRFNKIYILIICLFWASSCEVIGSINGIKPEGVVTDETLISDAPSANVALAGVYKSWRSYDISIFRNLTNLFTKTQIFTTIMGEQSFRFNDVLIDNQPLEKYYTSLYYVVNSANTFIANLEGKNIVGISQQLEQEMLAQAKFHRALANLMLLRTFGEFYDVNSSYGIVLNLEPVRSNNAKARASVADCYKSIQSDLDYASKKAPETSVGAYFITRTTAHALKARVALYMQDYANAAQYAKDALSAANVSGNLLEENYSDIYKGVYTSKELLFAPYTINPEQVLMSLWTPFSMGATGEGLKGVAAELVAQPGVEPDLITGLGYDSRFAQIFALMNQTGTNGINKYLKDNFTLGQASNTYYFIRLAEVYLIEAEAEARLGNFDKAREAFRTVALRAGYTNEYVDGISNDNFLITLLKHKYVELTCENNEDWFDLIRFTVVDKIDPVQMGMAVSMKRLMLPIPKNAMAGNNMLVQNKGYEN